MNFKLLYIALLMCTLIAIICSFFGQLLLVIVNLNMGYYGFLVFLAFPALVMTKNLNKYFQTSHINIPYFLIGKCENVSFFFPIIIIWSTLIAHLSGMSVGREGVAVQIGGSLGASAGNYFNLTKRDKEFLIYLGMASGFAALFHTWMAATIFIVELVYYKNKKLPSLREFVLYLLLSYYSSSLSLYLGLEKFFVKIADCNLESFDYIKLIIFSVLVIFLAIIFVTLQKKLKSSGNSIKMLFLLVVIVIILVTKGRYNSLGINFINGVFDGDYDFKMEDFILKLIITILCTGIGFTGGEVTNLFSIGVLFGVFYAFMFDLPIFVLASLGYVLMFCASARVCLTAILIALEVFGFNIALITIVPSLLIPIINKKYSIY